LQPQTKFKDAIRGSVHELFSKGKPEIQFTQKLAPH